MPTAYNKSFKINYALEGSGPPLLLLHDVSGSLYSWVEGGYVAPLSKRYQVITLALRGHGTSDKPDTIAAYVPPILVEDMLAVLDDLEVPAAHVVGYSIGGRIAFGFIRYVHERLLSITVGGTGYEKPPAEFFDRWINKQVCVQLQVSTTDLANPHGGHPFVIHGRHFEIPKFAGTLTAEQVVELLPGKQFAQPGARRSRPSFQWVHSAAG